MRNNIKAPHYYTRSLAINDPKTQILTDFYDPRVNFVCLDYPECVELIDPFEGVDDEKLDYELENFVANIIEAQVSIDLGQNEIILPKVLKQYAVDFDSSEELILQFIFKYLDDEYDYDQILDQVATK